MSLPLEERGKSGDEMTVKTRVRIGRTREAGTFGRAEFACVRSAVVLVHRVEQQPTLAAIKVHLAVEQRGLDQLPVGQPVHVRVLGAHDVALKQDRLPGAGRHVLDRPDDSQAGLHFGCCKEVVHSIKEIAKVSEVARPWTLPLTCSFPSHCLAPYSLMILQV